MDLRSEEEPLYSGVMRHQDLCQAKVVLGATEAGKKSIGTHGVTMTGVRPQLLWPIS